MTVSLTVSETISGSALSDSLAGGGTGEDLGSVVNGSYAPVISKAANTGRQDIFIRHDAVVDPITSLRAFIQQFGAGTGFTYGGASTAAADFATQKGLGFGSGNSKNNNDGLSGGLWMDMRANVVDANQFDQATFPTKVKIFGDNNTDGIDLSSAFAIISDAMVTTVDQSLGGDASNGYTPTAPVDGKIGKAGDNALGTRGHMRFRQYLTAAFGTGGFVQFEVVFAYNYTA